MAKKKIIFQGEPGAYSHLSCKTAFPDFEPLPCASFEEAFDAVSSRRAGLGTLAALGPVPAVMGAPTTIPMYLGSKSPSSLN